MIYSLTDSVAMLLEFGNLNFSLFLTQISHIALHMSYMAHFDGAFYGTFALKLESSSHHLL